MSAIFDEASAMWREMKAEYDAALQAAYNVAETETNGVLVNKKGRALGVTGTSLFSGSFDRAQRYASEELREHWTQHPRPSLAAFEAQWMSGRVVWA